MAQPQLGPGTEVRSDWAFGATLGPFGTLPDPSWAFGAIRAILGPFGAILGPVGPFGSFWSILTKNPSRKGQNLAFLVKYDHKVNFCPFFEGFLAKIDHF